MAYAAFLLVQRQGSIGQEPSALQLCGVALILAGLLSVAVRPRRVARA